MLFKISVLVHACYRQQHGCHWLNCWIPYTEGSIRHDALCEATDSFIFVEKERSNSIHQAKLDPWICPKLVGVICAWSVSESHITSLDDFDLCCDSFSWLSAKEGNGLSFALFLVMESVDSRYFRQVCWFSSPAFSEEAQCGFIMILYWLSACIRFYFLPFDCIPNLHKLGQVIRKYWKDRLRD